MSNLGSHERARDLTTVAERVDYCADLMAELKWERGKTAKILAPVWGVAVSTVEGYAAEASRRMTADADEVRRELTVGGLKLFRSAVRDDDRKGASSIGTLLATVSGAKAPEQHNVSVGADTATPEKARQVMQELFGSVTPKSDEDVQGE